MGPSVAVRFCKMRKAQGANQNAPLTKRDGYWPSSSFACFWNETETRSINLQKLAILSEQAWSIKDLFYGKRRLFSRGTQRVIPGGQESAILPSRVSQSQRRIFFILPVHEARHIRKDNIVSFIIICFRIKTEYNVSGPPSLLSVSSFAHRSKL